MMSVLLLVLFLGLQLGVQALHSRPARTVVTCSGGYGVITVNETTSCENAARCLSSNYSVPCYTLEYVLCMGIPACSRIVVDSDNETLNQTIVVNGSHDFVLQGNGPGAVKTSTVYCTNLTFTNCQNVLLSGMQFQACALSFMNCDNVTITNSFTPLAHPTLNCLGFPCKDEGKGEDEDEDEDECELNYYYDPLKQKRTYFASDSVCFYRNTTCVQEGYWFGTLPSSSNNTHTYGAFPCPFGFCDFSDRCSSERCGNRSYFCDLSEPNAQCYGNRGGVLCSQCAQNYSFTFDAVDCAPSEDCSYGYIVVMIGLVLLFWALLVTAHLVVVYLDLLIGSGCLYCFVFFFSVLQYFVGGSFPSKIVFVLELIVTGFIQLDPKVFGLIPICIPRDPLQSILGYAFLRYIHPIFLSVMIVLMICISKRHALPFFHHNKRATNSICILLYLLFFSLTQTSLSFLAPVKFQDTLYASLDPTIIYFTSYQLGLAILALLTMLVVVLFLGLLILSPLLVRWFNLLRLKPILDEFQACYKDKYRSFAGFYLTWRLLIFFLSLVGDYYVNIYLLQVMAIVLLMVHAIFQPYKEHWLNALDTLLITDLILLSILQGDTAHIVFASPGLAQFKDILVHLLILLPLVYFLSLCLLHILKRAYEVKLKWTRKGEQRMLRNVGGAHDDDVTRTPLFTAEREPLLSQQSVNSSAFDVSKSADQSDREFCEIPRLPTSSVVGLSQSPATSYSNDRVG